MTRFIMIFLFSADKDRQEDCAGGHHRRSWSVWRFQQLCAEEVGGEDEAAK
jgi:hypothetical protein